MALLLDKLALVPVAGEHFAVRLGERALAVVLVFAPLALVLAPVGKGDGAGTVALVVDKGAHVHLPSAVGESSGHHQLVGPLALEHVAVFPGLLASALDLVVLELTAVLVAVGPGLDTSAW